MSTTTGSQQGAGPTATMEYRDSSHLLGDSAALRARADEDGYLFFRGLLPPEPVLHLRRRFVEVLDRQGWIADQTDPMDAIADLDAFNAEDPADLAFCGVGIGRAAYTEIQRIREFHELAHHPRLIALYSQIFEGRDVLPHPRNIARVMVPGAHAKPTPAHQDFIHVQGTKNVWTAWFPLGRCPMTLGALTVLRGSHRDGILSYELAENSGGMEAYLCDKGLVWAQTDFEPGDVVTFPSETVHRALPHQAGSEIRMSCDYRYQPADEEIDKSSLNVHCDVTSWDDIYATWPMETIQWYWRRGELTYSDWDESIRWQKDKIC